MKLNMSKDQHVKMVNKIHKRARITEKLERDNLLKELQSKRSTPKYRQDPICVGGYIVKSKKSSSDLKRERVMKD